MLRNFMKLLLHEKFPKRLKQVLLPIKFTQFQLNNYLCIIPFNSTAQPAIKAAPPNGVIAPSHKRLL